MKKPNHRIMRGLSVLTLAYLFAGVACTPQFDDAMASFVQKPQMLVMTLDPPEIDAGDTVSADFLMADERGRLHPELALWVRNEPGDIQTNARSGIDEGQQQGFSEGDEGDVYFGTPGDYAFVFETYNSKEYLYDEDGFASQTVLLVVPNDPIDESQFVGVDMETAIEQYATGLMDGSVASLINFRTAIVSKREDKNRNPQITGLRVLLDSDDNEGEDITFTTGEDTPLDYTTSPAAMNPYIVTVKKTVKNGKVRYKNDIDIVYFEITATDPDAQSEEELEETLRYQWFSPSYPNGGEFKQTRKRIQEFTLPTFTAADDKKLEEPVPEDCVETDHRCQPNLYPVWIVVRDNGEDTSLGSTWAEFYVKVVLE